MQTHSDKDYLRATGTEDDDMEAHEFMQRLRGRAERMHTGGKSKIAGGVDGEPALASWDYKGFNVCQRPPDEQGILRISIGGGETPVPLNYLVFRGGQGECVDLLRKALRALEHDPG